MHDDLEIIELFDEDGNKTEFELLATFEVEDTEYAVLVPFDPERDPDEEEVEEAYILRIEHEGEDEVLVAIEDEEELNMAIEAYEELVKEESN